ncbi:hypothetical protein StRico65_03075 [Streptococcus thermophilus]|nr:hypothetical protein [Streptococcus thermophilus]MBW7820571.1 hypothetical protein [Streptococcus thermophilus]
MAFFHVFVLCLNYTIVTLRFKDNIKPTDNEILQLTDYLFKVDQWGYYEIILLGNCARTIEYNSFFLLTKEMVKNHI